MALNIYTSKLKSYITIAVLLSSVAWTFVGSTVTAVAADNLATVQDRAISWSLLRLVTEGQCELPRNISANDVDAGVLTKTVNVHSVGHHVSPESGEMTCKDAMTKAMTMWGGSDYRSFMTSIGYTQAQDGVNKDFIQDSYTPSKLANTIPAKYFAGGNRNSASNDILYHIFYTGFTLGCDASFKELYSKASNNDKNRVDTDDKTYRIYQVSPDGTIEDAIYTAGRGKGKIVSTGYGIGTSKPGKADCYELQKKLQNKALAEQYATLVKSGNDPTATGKKPTQKEDNGADCFDSGFALGWAICPIGSALAEGTRIIDDQLYSLLYIKTASWENSGVKAAWESFRIISSILIVLVALVGIASQVFSFDFISAYTIRKILPKLFMAVIFIQLSWFLAVMAINISNTVGYSIQALMSAPFEAIAQQYNDGKPISNVSASNSADGWIGFADVLVVYAKNDTGANTTGLAAAAALGGGTIVAALFSGPAIATFATGVGGMATVGVGAVLSFLVAVFIPVFLALLTSFVVIIFRIVLLIALTMVLPIAIVAWILPNTSKWFEKWWAMFFALLAFFPLIIVYITAGKIASLILATGAGDSGIKNFILLLGVIIAYFVPYFFIFKLIRFSGGSLGKIQSAIDSANNGIRNNEPLKNWRNRTKESAKFYSDEKARRTTENARSQLSNLEGQKGFRNSWRRAKAGVRQNVALGQLGNSGYFGELRETKLDETLDGSLQAATAAVARQMRGLTADESTKYLEILNSPATKRQFDNNNGIAEITVGDKTYRVTDSMWAASLPKQKDFKNSIDEILESSTSSDPHRAAVARRVVSDNGAMVDGMATDYSRTGLLLEDFHSDSSRSQVRSVMESKIRTDKTALAKIRSVVMAKNPTATEADVEAAVVKKIDKTTDDTLTTIRAKQTASYKDLPGHRRDKVKAAIKALSEGTEDQREEAIGLAMQLVGQGRELTGADLTDLSVSTGVDIGKVYKSGGNLTLDIDSNGKIAVVSSSGKVGNSTRDSGPGPGSSDSTGGGNSGPSSGGDDNSGPSSGKGSGSTGGGNSGQSTPATPSSRGPISDADISRIVNAIPKYMPSQAPFQGEQTVHFSKEDIRDLSHETAKEYREISKDDKDDDKGPPR